MKKLIITLVFLSNSIACATHVNTWAVGGYNCDPVTTPTGGSNSVQHSSSSESLENIDSGDDQDHLCHSQIHSLLRRLKNLLLN